MKKKFFGRILFVILIINSLFVFFSSIISLKAESCTNELTNLFQEQNKFYFEKESVLSNYVHNSLLSSEYRIVHFILNETEHPNVAIDKFREHREIADKLKNEIDSKEIQLYENKQNIIIKQNECKNTGTNLTILIYIMFIFSLVIILLERKTKNKEF